MNIELISVGYGFEPSRYSPGLGYSRLRVFISSRPAQRVFDVKTLHIPTFDGRFFHQTQVTSHELEPTEAFQVCLGQFSLESYRGEHLQGFSFGGVLNATLDKGELHCELTSNAPIFKLQDTPGALSSVIADEIKDFLAEKQATMSGHEDELYFRLSKYEPYALFLSCLVSLQKRIDSIPMHLRQERVQKLASNLKRAIKIVREADGWDGHAPNLDELLSNGGA